MGLALATGVALVLSRWRRALTFPGCSVPLAGLGLAGLGVEVPGLLDPGAALGLHLFLPGDVQPVPRAAAGGELAGFDPVVDDISAAAELVGGFGDADLAFGGGRWRGRAPCAGGRPGPAGGLGGAVPC